MFTNALLYAGLLPFVTSALVAVALLRYVSPRTLWATAVAAGFIAAQFGFKAQSGFGDAWQSITDPHEAADWLPLIVLLSLGVTLLFNHERLRRSRAMLALAAVFAMAVPIRLISGNVRLTHHWSSLEKLFYLVLLAATFAILWTALATPTREGEAFLRIPLLILVAVTSALAITLSGALVYGLACGAVAAAVSGTASAALLGPVPASSPRSSSLDPTGAASIITFSLGSLVVLSHFFAELTTTNATLLLVALAATGVPLGRFLPAGAYWQRIALRLLLCLAPLAAVILQVTLHHLAPGH